MCRAFLLLLAVKNLYDDPHGFAKGVDPVVEAVDDLGLKVERVHDGVCLLLVIESIGVTFSPLAPEFIDEKDADDDKKKNDDCVLLCHCRVCVSE